MKPALYIVGEKLTSLSVSFIISMVVTKFLGAAYSAQLASVTAICMLVSTFSKLGTDEILLSRISLDPLSATTLIKSTLKLRFILFSLLSSAMSVYFFNTSSANLGQLIAFSLLFAGAMTFDIGIIWARSRLDIKALHLKITLAAILGGGINLSLVSVNAPWEWFILANSAPLLFVSIVTFLTIERKTETATPRKLAFKDIGRGALLAAVITLYFKFDAIYLPHLVGNDRAGVYLLADRIASANAAVLGALPVSTIAYYNKYKGKKTQQDIFFAFLNLLTCVSILASLGSIFITKFIIIPYLGKNFEESFIPYLVLVLASPLFLQGGVIDAFLHSKSRLNFILTKSILALLIKAVTYLTLSANTNIVTVASMSVISAYVASLSVAWFSDRNLFKSHFTSFNVFEFMKSYRVLKEVFQR